MNNIQKCEELVITIYNNMDASHDYQHIERVYKNAEAILQSEPIGYPCFCDTKRGGKIILLFVQENIFSGLTAGSGTGHINVRSSDFISVINTRSLAQCSHPHKFRKGHRLMAFLVYL